jgi:hypothetical protein
MTKDDIIRMAREAGFGSNSLGVTFTSGYLDDHLERFAALVATAEREACAKVLDEMAAKDKLTNYYTVAALVIRARGQS